MTASPLFDRFFAECPLIAVIRGVTPGEVEAIGQAIFDAGIRIIEVPLNSPDPLASIEQLAQVLGERALIGAGTVLTGADVRRVRDAGGRLIVSPNTNRAVIGETLSSGLVSCPGYFTPSEGFEALEAGAHALKFFPAEAASPAVLRAHRAVFPPAVPLIAVGSVQPDGMGDWVRAGANGFGLGSGLFKPGQSAAATAQKAQAYVAGVKSACAG